MEIKKLIVKYIWRGGGPRVPKRILKMMYKTLMIKLELLIACRSLTGTTILTNGPGLSIKAAYAHIL